MAIFASHSEPQIVSPTAEAKKMNLSLKSSTTVPDVLKKGSSAILSLQILFLAMK